MATLLDRPALPRAIWALGFTSLLMDVSSEMIHGLLPLYITVTLGAGAGALGLIEGVAEATALIVKIFSGAISDWLGKRKLLAVLGYGLAAVTKPVFPLAATLGWVVAARFLDRVGKGIRGAPRDALVADLAPLDRQGEAFGLRQALDTIGAVAGPLIAVLLMLASGDNFRLVFWVAVLPAFLAVAVLAFFVPEPDAPPRAQRVNPFRREAMARLPARLWVVTAIGAGLAGARISEAFLIVRMSGLGLPLAFAPLVLVGMNAVYAAGAYPAGKLADRVDRRRLLALGTLALTASAGVLAVASSLAVAALGVALWGVHLALTQGLLAAMVAEAAPADLRGTAFGLFNLGLGLAMLAGNSALGWAWQASGPGVAYGVAAGLALMVAAAAALTPRAPSATA